MIMIGLDGPITAREEKVKFPLGSGLFGNHELQKYVIPRSIFRNLDARWKIHLLRLYLSAPPSLA